MNAQISVIRFPYMLAQKSKLFTLDYKVKHTPSNATAGKVENRVHQQVHTHIKCSGRTENAPHTAPKDKATGKGRKCGSGAAGRRLGGGRAEMSGKHAVPSVPPMKSE